VYGCHFYTDNSAGCVSISRRQSILSNSTDKGAAEKNRTTFSASQ
jgi:hypothetical protein